MRGTPGGVGFGRRFIQSIAFALALLIALGNPALIFAQEASQTETTVTPVSQPQDTTSPLQPTLDQPADQPEVTDPQPNNIPESTFDSLDTNTQTELEEVDPLPTNEESLPEASSSLDEDTSGVNKDPVRNTSKENFSTNSNSGALIYTYPLVVPPGRTQATTPHIVLEYSSSAHKNNTEFGYGWAVNIPYIERIAKKGTDKLYTQNYFNASLTGELASTSVSTTYISKVDNGDFLSYTFENNKWLVKDKYGNSYFFGTTSAARQDNPSNSSQVYKWMLEEFRDTNNNYIKYQYFKDSGQIYPSAIIYTGNASTDGPYEISFSRELRNDVATSSRTAFNVVTKQRINEIQVKFNNTWYRKYVLSYTTGDNTTKSLLNTITETGRDESLNSTSLPPTTFFYSTSTPGFTQDNNWNSPLPFAAIGWSDTRYDPGTRMFDINGDGLTDIVKAVNPNSQSPVRETYINTGNGFVASSTWNIPNEIPFLDYNNGHNQEQENSVRIFDVNGDGLNDILQSVERMDFYHNYFPDRKTYLNTGNGFVSSTTWHLPLPFFAIDSNNNPTDIGIRFVDLNGDGLIDLLQSFTNLNGDQIKHTYINNGHGFDENSNWNIPVCIISNYNTVNYTENCGTHLVDINGDGLTDVIQSAFDSNYNNLDEHAYINTGTGFIEDSAWIPPIYLTSKKSRWFYDYGVRLSDVNNDGLIDIIKSFDEYPDVPVRESYINNGHGFTDTPAWDLPLAFIKQRSNANYYHDSSVRLFDINGDGMDDTVSAMYTRDPEAFATTTYINNSSKPDLLKKVVASTGGSSHVVYKPSTKYVDGSTLLNPKLAQILTTVQAIGHNDGMGNGATTTYSYQGGAHYFKDVFDQKLAGFNTIVETDPALHVTKTYYHQGSTTDSTRGEYQDDGSKIGKVYRVEKYDNATNLYQKTINKWDKHAIQSNADFVKRVQTVTSDYDGTSNHKDKAEQYSYENTNGNLTQKVQLGEVFGNNDGTLSDTGTDSYTTTITYASGNGIVGLPATTTVINQSSAKVSESRHYYDSLAIGNVSKGNETKTEYWKEANTYAPTTRVFNSYGLVTSQSDPRSKTTSYVYDSYNLYPGTTTSPTNKLTKYLYDYTNGKPKQIITPNIVTYQFVFDGFDRVTQEVQPDLIVATTTVVRTTYAYDDVNFPSRVLKTDYLDSVATIQSYKYMDGFGRVIQERNSAEDSSVYAVKDTVYNARGMVASSSLPYFSNGTSITTKTQDSNLYTNYTYDTLGRLSSATNVLGTTATTYNNWKVTTTDARNKSKDLYKDAYNNLIQVDEHNGGATYSTYYSYNGLGNLTKITDANGNVRNFTYDGLGNKLTAEDLHAVGDTTFGTWTYTHDLAGNVTQVIDPKNQTINYTYDNVNRVLTENFTGLTGTELTNTLDGCPFGVGNICASVYNGINSNYWYNSLGLVKQESVRPVSTYYYTSYTYDRLGNIKTITYPDDSQVQYTYNNAGQVETIQRKENGENFVNVVTDIDYSPLGQITYQQNANGVETTYTYDATKLNRLTNKLTTKNNIAIQSIAYEYDAVGNIIKITDSSGTNAAKIVDYTYDDLNRLTVASSTNAVNNQNYRHTFSYNPIGNMIVKSDKGTYVYGGNLGNSYANPHAVTDLASTTHKYDFNGNLASTSAGVINSWNYRNLLTQSGTGLSTSTYAYDHNNNRVKYATTSETYQYANKYYNTTSGMKTKHIYANNQVVATLETPTSYLASTTVKYVHTDHLTGSNQVTNEIGAIIETTDYYPYGEIRLDNKTTSFSEQRKYAGHEFDPTTGYTYMQARYYDGRTGQFVSQDPVFLAVGNEAELKAMTGMKLNQYLADPQQFNSYSYARNNPLVYTDPNGEFAFLLPLVPYAITGITLATPVIMNYGAHLPALWDQRHSVVRSAPVIGDVSDFTEFASGKDIISGQSLSGSDRILSGLSTILPFVSGSVLRNGSDVFKPIAQQIAEGHAYRKHINEFTDLGIKSKQQYSGFIENIMNNPTEVKSLERGRTGYWHESSKTTVIHDPNNRDGGTAFRPENGYQYFDKELK